MGGRKPRTWFVSTFTELSPVIGRNAAVTVARAKGGLLLRECSCGCGKPASKAVPL